MVPLSLVHNLSLLASLSLVNGVLMRWFQRRGRSYQVIMGLAFGTACLVGMATPVVLRPGLIFDGRSIVLGIAGLFGGPVVAAIAGSMAAAYRLHLGGSGATMGVMVILASALLGVAGHHVRGRWPGLTKPWPMLGLGLLIHLVMLACMGLLPGALPLEALRRVGPAILLAYPLGFMLVGLGFVELERHFLMESALRDSEERYRSYVEHAPDGVFLADQTGAYLEVNPAACRMTGYSREELLGMKIPDLLPPESLEPGLRHFMALQERGFASGEFSYLHKSGELRCWLVEAVRLGSDRFLGFAKDMTGRRETEAALKASEARFRAIFEGGIDGIVMFDQGGRILDLNEAFARMRGYTRQEMVGMSLAEMDAPATAELVAERMRRLLEGETLEVELDQIHRDGHVFQVEATASRIFFGDQPVILSFHRDITERARARRAVEESEAKLQLLLASTAEGIYGIDLHGHCTFCNPACLRMLGYESAEQLLGRNMHQLIHHSDAQGNGCKVERCRIFRAFKEGRGFHADDEVFWRADGTCFPVEYWSYPQGRDGQAVGAVVTFIDLSERQRVAAEHAALEYQLQQAHKMESLGSLAGGIAHDMNNVLGAILGLASASLATQAPGSPAARAFDTILKAAERGGKLVKGLLNFARQSAVEERELQLNDLLQEEVRLLERTTLSKVQIVLDLAEDLRQVMGDGGALTHAFMNLCVNAVDAMPDSGTLTLRTRNVEPDWVEVEVQDTGTGMTPEVMERAMDPFFTTKAQGKGTGLGLALVYSTVKAHRGQMVMESQLGSGTCVRLRFPACEGREAAGKGMPVGGGQEARTSLAVLVVDDDELIQGSLAVLLEVLGHTATAAASGDAALALLESGIQADLVVLDMNMPGLDGEATLPRLRALRPRLPVLLSTGRSEQRALDLAESDPLTRLLPKPFTLEDMKQGIADVLGR